MLAFLRRVFGSNGPDPQKITHADLPLTEELVSKDEMDRLLNDLETNHYPIKSARMLAATGDVSIAERALRLLSANYEDTLRSEPLVTLLGALRASEAVPVLLTMLRNDQNSSRCRSHGEIAWALGKIGDSSCVQDLTSRLMTVNNRYYKQQVLAALGRIADQNSVPILVSYAGPLGPTDSEESWVERLAAVESLGHFKKEPSVVDALVFRLLDRSPFVAAAAAYSLGKIGARDALPSLRESSKAILSADNGDATRTLGACMGLLLMGDNRASSQIKRTLEAASSFHCSVWMNGIGNEWLAAFVREGYLEEKTTKWFVGEYAKLDRWVSTSGDSF